MAFDFADDQAEGARFAMIIQWSLFVPGVLMLLFPADRLLSSRVELRTFESFQSLDNSPRFRPWWWVPVLWLDPLRGFVGTLLLRQSLAIVSTKLVLAPIPAYSLMMAILGIAVLSQTFTRREKGALLAPIGFVAGIVGALTPWPVTVIGFVMAIAGLFAFRQFHAFFSVGLAAVAFLGFVLDTGTAWLVPALAALALPMLACLVTGSSLELPARNADGPVQRTGVAT